MASALKEMAGDIPEGLTLTKRHLEQNIANLQSVVFRNTKAFFQGGGARHSAWTIISLNLPTAFGTDGHLQGCFLKVNPLSCLNLFRKNPQTKSPR
ncbi:MAG: hypothetical protein WCJ07_03965 [Verrucomicrobiota bacterium]